MKIGLPVVYCTLFLFFSCKKSSTDAPAAGGGTGTNPPADTIPSLATVHTWLVDKKATDQSAALFYNLQKTAKTNILFGHQDDTKRGVTNASTQWANEQSQPPVSPDKSDVKDVTGAYPAVFGYDFLQFCNFSSGIWFDYEKQIAQQLTIDAYNRGQVITYCWHYANPVTKGGFYWTDSPVEAVNAILPGGAYNDVYKGSLQKVAAFVKSLTGGDGNPIPVIFRAFHEWDGDWFWWGAPHCTAADYKKLYQFTVTYLRDSLQVHNFLYAWSPDKNFTSLTQYLDRYPGNDYVDLLGTDNYGDLNAGGSITAASNKFKIVSDYAKSANKIAALTETGSTDNLSNSTWFTGTLLNSLKAQKVEFAYALAWANTKSNYYTPYATHPAAADFKNFKSDAYVMFLDKSPKMYVIK